MTSQIVTVADILIHLRNSIVDGRERGDKDELRRLGSVVGELGEIAERQEDRELIILTDNLNDAVADWLVGAPFKSTIPTVQEIHIFLERKDTAIPYWAR